MSQAKPQAKWREFWIDACLTQERIVFTTNPEGNWAMHFIHEPIHVVEIGALELANKKLAVMEEALEFYAEKNHYYLQAGMGERVSDTGQIAREALKKCAEIDPQD